MIGLATLFSASSPISLSESGNSYSYLIKQLKATAVGVFLCFLISMIDYRIFNNKFFRIIFLILIFAFPFLVYVFGTEIYGAKRWIYLFGFSIQLSEFTKILMILFLASYFSDITLKGKLDNYLNAIIIPGICIIAPALLIYKLENHLSSAGVLAFIGIIILFSSGVKLSYLFSTIIVAGTILGFLLKNKFSVGEGSFRSTRIKTFLNPLEDPSGEGYQITQSLYAVGSAGLFGLGIGQSRQKRLYLPFPQNDFIFAIFVEEMGIFAAIGLILLFFLLIFLGWRISVRSKDIFGKLISIGVVGFFTIQIFVNTMVTLGLVPVTGMALPFFSAGGSSIIVSYILVGFLISVSRITNHIKSVEEKNLQNNK